MIKSKKASFPHLNRLEDKVKFYLKEREKAEMEFIQTFEEFLNRFHLKTFFHNAHEHLGAEMIKHYRKNSILEDGIYILLRGQLVYVWTKNKYDRDRKQHLFNLAKNGSFSILMENPLITDPLLDISYSVLIQESLGVIESEQKSHMALEDCVLVKLTEKALEQTNFYKLKNERINFCEEAYFPGHGAKPPLFSLNTSLHHTFKQKKAYFHNKLFLEDIGILMRGSVKVTKKSQCLAEKFAILLPQIQYQVITAEVVVLSIEKNPTITFISDDLKEFYRQIRKNKFKKLKQTINQEERQSKYVSLHNQTISLMNRTEQKKRKKEINSFSKDYDNFCILSMYSCKENLKFVKKANQKNKANEEKCKSPLVLFNLKNGPQQKSYQSFVGEKMEETSHSAMMRGTLPFRQEKQMSIFKRYQSFSKHLYEKYMEYRYHASKQKKNSKKNLQ